MPNSNASSRPWRRLYRVAAYLLFGFCAGVAWFAALMPVGVTGAVGYDLARCAFALCVLVALLSLFSRPWRDYGLGVFFVGLLLGIACWAVLVPMRIRPGGMLMFSMFLFGFPLATTALLGFGFFLACRRAEHSKNQAGGGRSGLAAAPRRFGIGTLMIVVLAVSLLFAIAKWVEMPPPLSIFAGSFLGIIGGCQMLMNKVPRAASIGAGALLLPLTLAITWGTIGANPRLAMFVTTPADILFVGAHLVAFGAVCGYMGGVLVAGLFLVIELAGRPGQHSRVVKPPV